MMPARSTFILAYILMSFKYYSAATYTKIREDDIFENCKIVSHCDGDGTKSNTSSFTTIDFETGTVKVILPGSFERHLLLLAGQEGQPCEDMEYSFDYSRYDCEMQSGNMSSECSYQEVIFRYLYSSCYQISDDKLPDPKSLAKGYVQTNYTRVALEEDCSLNVGVDLLQEKYALISVNMRPFLYNSVLKFVVNDSKCSTITKRADFWWRVEVKEDLSDNIIIEKNETQNRTVECAIVQNEGMDLRQLRCEVDWTDILCLVIIREKSTSPIAVKSCDVDNDGDNIFRKTVVTLRPFNTTERTLPAADISRTTNTVVLMFIPLTAAIICFCFTLYFSDAKDHLLREKGSDSSNISPDEKCKVLLLYPQDCDSFMAAMKTLKNVLQCFEYFEVYDYFDPKRFGEIACDPQGWISKLLSQKDVRIILAETDTALLHQQAIVKKCVVNYVSPLPYSNLFAYGLQNLLHSLRPQEYSRIFLIRFEDITQGKQNLKLSRYERYRLPEHLSNLISCLSNCNIISFEEVEESLEIRRLKHSIDKFRQFQQHNPTYHAEICNNLTKLI